MPATKSRTKVDITPLANKVVILRDEADSVTDAGIVLPESAKDQPKSGTVQAVGPGALNTDTGERIPMTVKKGDRVLFSSYAGTELNLDGADEELLIMTESDILAIID